MKIVKDLIIYLDETELKALLSGSISSIYLETSDGKIYIKKVQE